MTDLIPPPVTARIRVPLVAPAGVLDEQATGSVDLGPDWSALRAFAGVIVALAVASLVGQLVAGPVGIVVAAGLVALVLFVAAHIRAWALSRRVGRRVDRCESAVVDAYASTGIVGNRSAATDSTVFVWRCDVCRVVSVEASTRPEVVDLARTHDWLHHGRPTAAVLAVTGAATGATRVSMLSTREGL